MTQEYLDEQQLYDLRNMNFHPPEHNETNFEMGWYNECDTWYLLEKLEELYSLNFEQNNLSLEEKKIFLDEQLDKLINEGYKNCAKNAEMLIEHLDQMSIV